ncbi:MAG: type II toxin-antitoxin system HicA family toxin [Candidatus Spechtbacteria bacterium]|nr:type II toxin-antitoxin system HicA family toxin [Candidatus Spechtbacteria bacterium]
MRALTARQVIRILRDNGFVLSRQRGSHMIWHNPQTNASVPVPLHGNNKSIPQGTLLAIVKQSGLAREKFK